MSDSVENLKFKYAAVVLHSDDELELAEKFCKRVSSMDLANGQSPKIFTLERISHPGKTYIANLDDAINSGRYIFCSEEYYDKEIMGRFSGEVAMQWKIPDRFVKLIIGKRKTHEQASNLPTMGSFHGLLLNEDWDIPENAKDKLKMHFDDLCNSCPEPAAEGVNGSCGAVYQQESLSDLSIEQRDLDVMNPSISSSMISEPDSSISDETQLKQITTSVSSDNSQSQPQADQPADQQPSTSDRSGHDADAGSGLLGDDLVEDAPDDEPEEPQRGSVEDAQSAPSKFSPRITPSESGRSAETNSGSDTVSSGTSVLSTANTATTASLSYGRSSPDGGAAEGSLTANSDADNPGVRSASSLSAEEVKQKRRRDRMKELELELERLRAEEEAEDGPEA